MSTKTRNWTSVTQHGLLLATAEVVQVLSHDGTTRRNGYAQDAFTVLRPNGQVLRDVTEWALLLETAPHTFASLTALGYQPD